MAGISSVGVPTTHPDYFKLYNRAWFLANKSHCYKRRRERRAANPEKFRARERVVYWRDPIKSRALSNQWRRENLELARELDRIRNRNPQRKAQKREIAKRWKKNNYELWKIAHRLYQGRRRQLIRDGTVTIADWLRILELHENKCALCDIRGVKLEQDHIFPLSLGGKHTPVNLQPLCKPCNTWKKDKVD